VAGHRGVAADAVPVSSSAAWSASTQRPQEADERAIPGHWEGDLLLGKNNQSAIGTLVERATGYAMLVHLPDGYKTEHVVPAIATKIKTLPESLRRSSADHHDVKGARH
jgi:IS30 family transposase